MSSKEQTAIEVLQQTVSASRLNCWLQCRLKFYFRYVLKLAKPKTGSLHYGSVVHLVLQHWNLTRWRREPFEIAKLKSVFETGWAEQSQIDWDGEDGSDAGNSAHAVVPVAGELRGESGPGRLRAGHWDAMHGLRVQE